MGIFRVQLATLDTTTNGAADGYRDYSCAHGTVLQRGSTYTLAVRTNPNADEAVRAWIDFDNNGVFAASEQVLTSTARQHQASFTVPATALVGQPLRLRIAADYVNAPVPTACSTPQYSQTEDYRVMIATTALVRPVARFTALNGVSCGGPVVFQDQSSNAPTAWRWTFGDGTVSTQQHPQHTYALPGTYSVRLRACNATGCDSVTRANYIYVLADAPQAAPCQPATSGYCCGFGLTRFQLGLVNNASVDGAAGYEDFSCAQRAALTADQPYTLQLTTGSNAHDVRVYLDRNDNGQFDLPGELLYEGLAVHNPSVVMQVASGAGLVYNRPLRLRCWVDAAGNTPFGPCVSPQQGQVEDYSVVVAANAAPPSAQFSLTYQQLCGPVRVSVTNTSTGGPTSYAWDFGDGSTSTATVPPVHTYATGGIYDLTLVARNAFGTDTLRRTVVVAGNCPTYCEAAGVGGDTDWRCYFTRVQLADLDNVDPRSPGIGYRDFTSRTASLQPGQTYTLRAESLPWIFAGAGPWSRVTLWIDYNQDGNFSAAERVTPVLSFSPHLLTFRVPLSARPGATRLRVQMINASYSIYLADPYNACPPSYHMVSTEDYTVLMQPAAMAPRAGFQVQISPSCNGTVQLRDTSWASPSRWRWRFGDGATSTAQHPQHAYAQPGTYAVSLTVANRYGADSVTRAGYVIISQLAAGPRPAACVPPDGPSLSSTLGSAGIDLIQVGGLSYGNAIPNRYAPYRDETCAQATAQLTAGSAAPFYIRGLTNYFFQVRVWLDVNDDGVFNPSNEQVYVGPVGTPTASLAVPAATVLNRPLRMRVWWMSDFGGGYGAVDGGPCFRSERNGQVRDFAAIVTSPLATLPGRIGSVELFPNPSTGQLTLQSQALLQGPIQVRSITGQLVFEQDASKTPSRTIELDLHQLPDGIYFLHLPQSQLVRKITIMH